MATAPSRRPAAPGFSPKTPPPGSSRPRAAGDAQCDALRVPDVICPSQPVPARGPRSLCPTQGSRFFPTPRTNGPGPAPASRAAPPQEPAPASCGQAGPGAHAAPLPLRPAARAHRPHSCCLRHRPRLTVRGGRPGPPRAAMTYPPPIGRPARTPLIGCPGSGCRAAPPPTLPGAPIGRRPASPSRREIRGARGRRSSAMERLRDVRERLQDWERAFRRRSGRRPGQVRAARGRGAKGAAAG